MRYAGSVAPSKRNPEYSNGIYDFKKDGKARDAGFDSWMDLISFQIIKLIYKLTY